MKSLSLAISLLLPALTQISHADPIPHADYGRMKLLRNYFSIVKQQSVRTRYQVWFNDRSANACNVSFEQISDLQELASISGDRPRHERAEVSCAWGAFGGAPQTIPPLPLERVSEADSVLAAIRTIHPQATELKIAYTGRSSLVEIDESIPTGINEAKPDRRTGVQANASFLVSEDFRTIEKAPGISGVGSLRVCNFNCDRAPIWIPYVVPSYAQGKTILFQSSEAPTDPKLKKVRDDLLVKIRKTVRAIARGQYAVNFTKILNAQGSDLIPRSANAQVTLELDLYGRSSARRQINSNLKLNFELNKASQSVATFTEKNNELGISVEAKLDLSRSPADGSLVVTLKTDRGETAEFVYSVDPSSLVRDGSRALAHYLSIELKHPTKDEAKFKGFGDITSIDAYLGGELRGKFY